MVTRTSRLAALLLLLATAVVWLDAAAPLLVTEYWPVPPDVWKGTSTFTFPEASDPGLQKNGDLGIAFSGGGTRSATLTVGQLRGLLSNKWLDRVRYITAVSGGSWAAAPYTYSSTDPKILLGELLQPEQLTKAVVEVSPPRASLARSIVDSKLLAAAAPDIVKIAGRSLLDRQNLAIPDQARSLAKKFTAGSSDETYADILGRIFITPHVPGGIDKAYTWHEAVRNRIKELAPSLSVGDFVMAADDRPFLIVGGSIIYDHPTYDFPRLIPVEMTPIYTGVRQQYGDKLGGIYVSPFAYDVASAGAVREHTVQVKGIAGRRPFTLADMIATSGAAPLLALFRGQPVAAAGRATAFFPTFNHFTIRKDEARQTVEHLLHGDGGFTDNLGVMPLLARRVHNIIVFVNAADPLKDNPAVESLFWPLDRQEDAGGDRSMNYVFDHEHFDEVDRGLQAAVAARGGAVYCGRNWKVRANELYNIAAYDGLNICWVNNQPNPTWVGKLPAETQAMVGSKSFKNFPLFATFGQNIPYAVRLTPPQVNLLSQLAAWTVTNEVSRRTMAGSLDPALNLPR